MQDGTLRVCGRLKLSSPPHRRPGPVRAMVAGPAWATVPLTYATRMYRFLFLTGIPTCRGMSGEEWDGICRSKYACIYVEQCMPCTIQLCALVACIIGRLLACTGSFQLNCWCTPSYYAVQYLLIRYQHFFFFSICNIFLHLYFATLFFPTF